MSQKLKRRMCIALIVILLASVLASALQTSFRTVRIRDMSLVTDQQQELRALAFIPRNASAENPLPCIITGHGGFHSAEMQDAACIELSRRGFVVIAIDMYGHGMSSNTPVNIATSEMTVGLGIGDMVEYVSQGNMDFVDTSRIGIMGHSMGTRSCVALVKQYANKYEELMTAAIDPASDGGEAITEAEQAQLDSLATFKAAFFTGNTPGLLGGFWEKIHGLNLGWEYGIYEESSYSTSTGKGDISAAPEGLEIISAIEPGATRVEPGKYYGSKEDKTLRVLYQPKTTHLTDFIAPEVTTECISFFTYVFDVNTPLAPTSHTYLIKEFVNLIAFVALFFLIVPFGDMFLTTPALAELRDSSEKKGNTWDAKKYWLGFALTTVASIVGFLVANMIDTKHIIFKPNPMTNSNIFPLNESNIVLAWMVIFAAWNFVWFFINRDKDADMGLKISGKGIVKTLAAAAAIVGLIFVVVWFCKWAFNVDFRFWKVAVKQFNNEKIAYFLQYVPFTFLFMLSASLLTNNLWNYKEQNEFKNLLLIGVSFALGGILVWALQYGKLFIQGATFWTNMNGVASVALYNWIVLIIPFMLRKFYKLTGKNWLGPITLSVLFTLIDVSTTSVQAFMP